MTVNGTHWSNLASDIEVGPKELYDENKIFEYIQNASDCGECCATYALARRHLCGISTSQDCLHAKQLFQKASESGCGCAFTEACAQGLFPLSLVKDIRIIPDEEVRHCTAMLAQIISYIFGLGCIPSITDARSIFSRFPKTRKCQHHLLAEAFLAQVTGNYRFTDICRDFFLNRALPAKKAADHDLDTLWDLVKERHSKEASITFLCMASVAVSRGWSNYPVWRRRAILTELELLNVDRANFARSHSAIGLPQNVHSSSGIMYPHKYVIPKNDKRMWMTHLDGIHYETKGTVITNIMPIGRREHSCPALITGDDFAIATCLAFASGIDNPSMSLEPPPKHFLPSRVSLLMYKEFDPPWLAATEFGGSMYCADLMAGRFDSHYGLVSFEDPLRIEISDLSNEVRGYFEKYSPIHPITGSDSSRICLSLYSVNNIHRRSESCKLMRRSQKHDLIFDQIGFRIDGSGSNYMENHRTAVYENDPLKPEAHHGLLLTNRLSKIENAFPVFRRVKLLLALTRSLIELRKSGLSLDDQLQAEVTSLQRELHHQSEGLCLYVAAP